MIVYVERMPKCGNEIPTQGSTGAAGYDLRACVDEQLYPGQRMVIQTGLKFAIPKGYVGFIKPRSGLAVNHGIDTLAGVIDSDYRGEVGVVLINHGDIPFNIASGDRIGQIVFLACGPHSMIEVREVDETARGSDGYGSTGVK